MHVCLLCPNPLSLKYWMASYCPWLPIVSLPPGLHFPITQRSRPFLLFSLCSLSHRANQMHNGNYTSISTISKTYISLVLGSSVSQFKGVVLIPVIIGIYGKYNWQLRKLPACYMQWVSTSGSLIHFLYIREGFLFFFQAFVRPLRL